MTYLAAVYGEADEHGLFLNILKLLNAASVPHIGIDMHGNIHPRLKDCAHALILETSNIDSLSCGADILIFKKSSSNIISLPNGQFKSIIISDECAPFVHGAGSGQAVITCGPNLKSSVTISSSAEGKLYMFIQRRLAALSGEVIEPEELSLTLKADTSYYDAMASALCCMLLGIGHEKFDHIPI